MDRKYIDDHHVIARYLADRLSDEEREAFEAYYLDHPEVVREMDAVARFKAGMLRLQESGELDPLLKAERRLPRWQILAAAAAVAAVAVGVGFVITRNDQPPLAASALQTLRAENGELLSVASTHMIFRRRNSGPDATIDLPGTRQAIELQILPEFASPSASYRISVARTAGAGRRPLAEVAGLRVDQNGLVRLYLDAALLEPGQYELELRSDPPTDVADEVSFFTVRVRAANP